MNVNSNFGGGNMNMNMNTPGINAKVSFWWHRISSLFLKSRNCNFLLAFMDLKILKVLKYKKLTILRIIAKQNFKNIDVRWARFSQSRRRYFELNCFAFGNISSQMINFLLPPSAHWFVLKTALLGMLHKNSSSINYLSPKLTHVLFNELRLFYYLYF